MPQENENTNTTETPNFDNVDSGDKDITDVLKFDPFAGKNEDEIPQGDISGDTDKAKASGEGDENEPKAPAAPAKAPETKPAESVSDATGDQVKHWQSIAESYQQQIQALKTSAKPETPAEPEVKIPDYNFDVPDKLIEVLTTEQDPARFKEGVIALMKGIAGAVHAQMYNHVDETLTKRFSSIPQMINAVTTAQKQATEMRADFYGKYPEFDHPQMHDFVMKTAEAVAKETGKKAWDAELRDATATRMKEIISIAGKAPGNNNPQPPRMLSSQGSRPAAPAKDASSDIMDTLFG